MDEPVTSMDLQKLKALTFLGRGGKGVVFLVQKQESSGEIFALKAISKALILKKGEDGFKRLWFERDVLNLLQHPLLPRLQGFFVTEKIVGLVLEYCSGGDLSALRKKQTEKMFSDEIVRFYAAELVLILEYLHGLGIVYRDLKPENVLIQGNGHLMLVDFDLSAKLAVEQPETSRNPAVSPLQENLSENNVRKNRFPRWMLCNSGRLKKSNSKKEEPEKSVSGADSSVGKSNSDAGNLTPGTGKSNSFVGTEDYVAPEIISGSGHDFAVDWWCLGVMLYEMLYGKTPFRGSNRKETFYRILTKQPELVGTCTPLRDLIRRLLEKDPGKRISGPEIKEHEFFRGVDWDSVLKISRPPFIPDCIDTEKLDKIEEKGIDVEGFVEEINAKRIEKENGSENKGVWVDTLSIPPQKNSDFLEF